jgi:hypothetical protein
MLESIVDLLNGLSLIAVILLMIFCIIGSIVAALHGVGRGTTTSTSSLAEFVDDVDNPSEGLLDAKPQVRSAGSTRSPLGPGGSRSCL